jgi:hypothetical protein
MQTRSPSRSFPPVTEEERQADALFVARLAGLRRELNQLWKSTEDGSVLPTGPALLSIRHHLRQASDAAERARRR